MLQLVLDTLPIQTLKEVSRWCSKLIVRMNASRKSEVCLRLGMLSPRKTNTVKEPFDEILSWTQVPQKESELETLKPADIRVFCDGDAKKEENGAGKIGAE